MRISNRSNLTGGRRELLAASCKVRGEQRAAIPLSLLFASVIASGEIAACYSGACEGYAPVERNVVVSDDDFHFSAGDDGVLDETEGLNVCNRCESRGSLIRPGPRGGDAGLDATSDGSFDHATSDDASDADLDDAADSATTADVGSSGAGGGGGHGGTGGGTGGSGTGGTGGTGGSGTGGAASSWCRGSPPYGVAYGAGSYRGATTGGHTIFCRGQRDLTTTCGRNSACHASLGRGIGATAVARWLAYAAATESASIRSFQTLRRELARLGAPADLVARAHRAAREEARHTRLMLALARARGGQVEWPRSAPLPPRDLEAIAIENAVEGCVHETWSAFLNQYQATHAEDPEVRAVMKRVAADETSHAELARDVDRWAMGVLPRAARARVTRSKRAAARALVETRPDMAPSERAVLGLPAPDRAWDFARELAKHLWS